MNKKLPKVFANKIEKNLKNNKKVYYSNKDEQNEIIEPKLTTQNIYQKIHDIFTSSQYVYKADVKIKIKDKIIEKRIIGKNNNNLITYDNELIPISEIEDIYINN